MCSKLWLLEHQIFCRRKVSSNKFFGKSSPKSLHSSRFGLPTLRFFWVPAARLVCHCQRVDETGGNISFDTLPKMFGGFNGVFGQKLRQNFGKILFLSFFNNAKALERFSSKFYLVEEASENQFLFLWAKEFLCCFQLVFARRRSFEIVLVNF